VVGVLLMLPAPFPKAALTLPYGATTAPYTKTGPHQGDDYDPPGEGNPILASGPGRVAFNAWDQSNDTPSQLKPNRNAGNAIDIVYDEYPEYTVRHMHRQKADGPKKGDRVDLGTYLGSKGGTGYTFGDHLHHEVWLRGARVSPSRIFDKSTSVAQAILANGHANPFEPAAPKPKGPIDMLDMTVIRDKKSGQVFGISASGRIKHIPELNSDGTPTGQAIVATWMAGQRDTAGTYFIHGGDVGWDERDFQSAVWTATDGAYTVDQVRALQVNPGSALPRLGGGVIDAGALARALVEAGVGGVTEEKMREILSGLTLKAQ
jgi:murein DD-endopeptidase MepM/ murein hydrolase activator NlpD